MVDELRHANCETHHLMDATAIATILDRRLSIMRDTLSTVTLFNLIPTDVGRRLTDLTTLLDYLALGIDVQRVLDRQVPIVRGAIVNIALSSVKRVAGGVAPYAISKAGVIQATRVLALELARYGIRVNELLPGHVVTDLNRDFLASETGGKSRNRIPSREFASHTIRTVPCHCLLADAGRAMSGSSIVVDGAHLVSTL
jgi:NAD(P)-dependent dehydrogenase (short-subunit alcohol dehydrogenase family)